MSSVEPNVIQAGDILVVDDTAGILKLLTLRLEAAGYRTRSASNGGLALRMVQDQRPALILLDIRMPDMDGFEVCRRLKENDLARDIPIIFLSAVADAVDKSRGFELGAVDYITKPFYGVEVLARVRLHLALAAANEQLGTNNLHLQQVNERLSGEIAERKRAEEAREQLVRQLALLNERLATAQEAERHKIAYELHEELGQEIATLKLYIEMMGPGSGATQAESPHKQALEVAAHATEQIRKLVMSLEPRELEYFGLHAALRSYCEQQGEASGWNLHIDVPEPDLRAPRAVERACFRVLQEGLGNVQQHAQATEVWVHVQQAADKLELSIRDNGIGFDVNGVRAENGRESRGLGLFGMRIRAEQVGGSVEIRSVPGAGTEIRAVFPLTARPG